MRASPRVVRREILERAVWGDQPPDSDALRAHMHVLRSAVPSPREKQVFTSVTIGMFATLIAIVAQFLGIDLGQVKGQ